MEYDLTITDVIDIRRAARGGACLNVRREAIAALARMASEQLAELSRQRSEMGWLREEIAELRYSNDTLAGLLAEAIDVTAEEKTS